MTEKEYIFSGDFEVPAAVTALLREILPWLEPAIDKKSLPLLVLTREAVETTEVLLREPARGKIVIAPLIEEALVIMSHGIVVADSWLNAENHNLGKLAEYLGRVRENFRIWFFGFIEMPVSDECQQSWARLLGKGLGLSDMGISTGDLDGLNFYCVSARKGKFSRPDPDYLILP